MATGQVILITGGSDGLGFTAARALAHAHQVVLLSRNRAKLERAAAELGCQWVCADVTQADQLDTAVAEVLGWHRRIDALVTCAGRLLDGALDQYQPYEIEQVLNTNVLGTMLSVRAVLPRMKQLQRGRIIAIGSQAGLYGRKYRSVYNASKWALRGFCTSLQQELVKYGIGVSLIQPGLMQTQLLQKAGVDDDLSRGIDPMQVARMIRVIVQTPSEITIPELNIQTLRDVQCW